MNDKLCLTAIYLLILGVQEKSPNSGCNLLAEQQVSDFGDFLFPSQPYTEATLWYSLCNIVTRQEAHFRFLHGELCT